MAEPNKYIIKKPLHAQSVTVTVAEDFGTDSETLTFPTDAEMLVQDIQVRVFDQAGGVVESTQSRDRILLSIQSNNSDEEYIKTPIDVFALNEFARSNRFAGFVVRRQTSLEVTVQHSNDAGAVKLTTPLHVEVTFLGQKVQTP